ncbi:MAG: flagellar protein FlgN [Candidatus Kapaibacteriales bacterium]
MNNIEQVLEEEYQLLNQILKQMELQKQAMIKYDISEVEREANILLDLIRKLKILEDTRINLLARDFKLSKREASKIKMSKVIENFPHNEKIQKIHNEFSKLVPSIIAINSINNLLANRALNSLSEIMSFLSNGSNSVCDVKI